MARPRRYIACKAVVHPRADLRFAATMGQWIARDLDQPEVAWIWGTHADAWDQRSVFRGRLDDYPAVDAWRAYSTGWPGARPEYAAPGDKSTRLTVGVTLDEANAIAAAAAAEHMTVSQWLRVAAGVRLAARGLSIARSPADAFEPSADAG